MEFSPSTQRKILKALKNLKLSGVKIHKHCSKPKKQRKALPLDIYMCPKLVSSAFNSNYQMVLYKGQDQKDDTIKASYS
ncbi:hypothetical protein SteCoe_19726 [Stentor coeruleus]|uniref:Uncharacterized protein n=1 Tax=Stentor coeruleus TaxID=5963 RepID=A0A1R2BTQ9_9CILI|nr:hypothetical protein SteCoe_19726 [Stentor coeruleus]